MSAAEFLTHLRKQGVDVSLDGEQLRVRAPKDALTPEIVVQLRDRRDELCEFLNRVERSADTSAGMVPLRATGSDTALFMIPGHNGDIFAFLPLMKALSPNQPLFAFQPPGLVVDEKPLEQVEELAQRFIVEMRKRQPQGPFRIGGYCTGGTIAFEAARHLQLKGEEVEALFLFGASSPPSYQPLHQLMTPPVRVVNRIFRFLRETLQGKAMKKPVDPSTQLPPSEHRDKVEEATSAAVRSYEGQHYPGRIDLFIPSGNPAASFCEKYYDWKHYCEELKIHEGPTGCIHSRMLRDPYAQRVARHIETILAENKPADSSPESADSGSEKTS